MIAEALWHLEIEAGAEVPVLFPRDIQITNAALTETIGDVNNRTVLKMKFSRPNPRELGRDDEDDSEYDSEDDEDFDGLSPEDLESDEDDDEEVKALKAELKKTGAAVKGDDDEASDDEDDEDFSDDEEPVDIALCALTPGKIEQVQLNLICNQDDVVLFRNLGKNTIHLLGNYINQAPFEGRDDYDDMSDDEEDYSFDEEDEEEGSDIDMADLEKVVGRKGKSDSHRFEEVADESKAAKKAAAAPVADSKKRKAEEPVKKVEKKQKTDAKVEAPVEKKTEKKAEKPEKKVEKKADKPEQTSSKKTTLPSGLIIEDVKVGDGPVAKKGKRCGMRYIGKLTNGKQFDANTAGAPFVFRLGAGEVIKGWDQGVSGMAVGGERKLTVPAALAYGNQKIPGIPANSTLVFDIKLVNVK